MYPKQKIGLNYNVFILEEEDRRKVKSIPRKCEKILKQNVQMFVFMTPLNTFIQRFMDQFYEKTGK